MAMVREVDMDRILDTPRIDSELSIFLVLPNDTHRAMELAELVVNREFGNTGWTMCGISNPIVNIALQDPCVYKC